MSYDPTADPNNTWDTRPPSPRSGDPTKLNPNNPLMHPEWGVGIQRDTTCDDPTPVTDEPVEPPLGQVHGPEHLLGGAEPQTESEATQPNDHEEIVRLQAEVAQLRRWKAEASEVILGLQDLGKALGIPLGERITGPAATEAAKRLSGRVTRVHEALAVLDEVAFEQIALEEMLTVLPTGPWRAQVPSHWREQTEKRVRPYREHFAAALVDPEPEGD